MIILYLSSSNKLLKEGMGQMPDAREFHADWRKNLQHRWGERVADVRADVADAP